MKRDYQNNFMLNRIGGLAFDIMIVAGVCAIEIGDLSGLWIPLAIICVIGGFVTFFYIKWVCDKVFPDFALEQTVAMYGMLTGTVSTGMILLREVDPELKTPSSTLLVTQSIPASALGFPLILLMGFAPQSELNMYITLGIIAVFFVVLNLFLFRRHIFKRRYAASGMPPSGGGDVTPESGEPVESGGGAVISHGDAASDTDSAVPETDDC